MDIRQHAQWQEVLEDIKSMTDRALQSSRQGHYRLYKWRSSYIIEEAATEQTIVLRTELKQVINAAKEKGINLRDVILDL